MSKYKTVFLIYCSIISETQQKAGEKQIWIVLVWIVGDGEGVTVQKINQALKGKGSLLKEEEFRGLLEWMCESSLAWVHHSKQIQTVFWKGILTTN